MAGFVLDFDGTLSPIVSTPGEAAPVPGVRPLLESLSDAYRTVTLVSGRRAADVAARVGARGVRYVGLYGAEELAGGGVVQAAGADAWREAARRFAREAAAFLTAGGPPGCTAENKDLAVSLHHRLSPDPGAGTALLEWAMAHRPDGFEVTVGRKVVEVRPRAATKAAALENVVREAGLRWLLVAGDDAADIDAFRRAGELLGPRALRAGVASGEAPVALDEATDAVLASPGALLDLLRRFLPTFPAPS